MGGSTKSDDAIGFLIGDVGRWQIEKILINFAISLPGLAQIFVAAVFAMQTTDFRCVGDDNGTWTRNCTVGCGKYEYDTSFWTDTVPMSWDMICENDYFIVITKMITFAGFATGTFAAGLMSDKLGRRSSLLIMSHLFFATGLIATILPSFPAFLIAWYFLGVSSIGVYTSAIVWNLETVCGKWKMIIGMLMALAWPIARLSAVALSWMLRDWKTIIRIVSGIHIFTPLTLYFVPESPRWLLASKNENYKKRAEEILLSAVRRNNINEEEFLKNVSVEVERSRQKDSTYHPYYTLFKNRSLRNRSFILFVNWFTNSLILYGLNLNWKSLTGNLFTNFAIAACIDTVARLLTILVLRKINYRKVYIFALIMVGICFLASLAFNLGEYERNWPIVALSMCGTFFISISFSIIWIYTAELFPTNYRNGALGASSFSARVGGIVATTMGSLSAVHVYIPKLIFSICALVSAGLVFFLPDTDDSFPESIEDCENKK